MMSDTGSLFCSVEIDAGNRGDGVFGLMLTAFFGYGTWQMAHGTRVFSVPGVCCEVHSRQSGPAQGNGDS